MHGIWAIRASGTERLSRHRSSSPSPTCRTIDLAGGPRPTARCSGFGGVAQLVEQLVCNQQAAGSSPVSSTKLTKLNRSTKRDPGRAPSRPSPGWAMIYP